MRKENAVPYSPFSVLEMPDDRGWPEGVDPYNDAIHQFDPQYPEQLIKLLESADDIVSRRGLYVFGNLGQKAAALVDHAIPLYNHSDFMARNALMDGVLSYVGILNPSQIEQILNLASDNEELVRAKVIALIAAVENDVILAAIQMISDKSAKLAHVAAFEASSKHIDDVQVRFEEALRFPPLQSTYSFASIERAARDGLIENPPVCNSDSYIAESVASNTKRILKKVLK